MRTPQRAGLPRWATTIVVAAAAGVLAGCVSLLPQTPPVQLYDFGELPPPSLGQAVVAPGRPGVVLTTVEFPTAAMGDQILTVTGDQAAYVAGARWATPAAVRFRSDVERAFEAKARGVHLLPRGEFTGTDALLRLDVGDFAARYDAGPGQPPTVLVSVRATLSRPGGEGPLQQSFTVRQPATDNRVGAIVQAFDRATLDVLQQVTAWTDAEAPALARQAPPAAPAATRVTSTTTTTERTARP